MANCKAGERNRQSWQAENKYEENAGRKKNPGMWKELDFTDQPPSYPVTQPDMEWEGKERKGVWK